jgi:hypothetical protein
MGFDASATVMTSVGGNAGGAPPAGASPPLQATVSNEHGRSTYKKNRNIAVTRRAARRGGDEAVPGRQ